jgi:transcriptional regulator with XRE-family HTH domain
MQPEKPNLPQEWLLSEFERFKAKNSRFSLRAMALRVNLSPGRLSEFLSGKRRITPKTALKIAARLGLDPRKSSQFVGTTGETPVSQQYRRLELDQFSVIADWYHFAILSLMETKDFRSSESWIARRLGISALQVKAALHRLQRIGLVRRTGEKWRSTGRNLETPSDIASSALRKSHRQDLRRALQALDEVSVEDRDITSMTMAIDIRRLSEAKTRINRFRKDMAVFLEEGEATEVYSLNVQLIPVSKKLKEEI